MERRDPEIFRSFLKDIWAGPPVLIPANLLFHRGFDLGPAVEADANDAAGAKAFEHEWNLELHLNPATSEFRFSV